MLLGFNLDDTRLYLLFRRLICVRLDCEGNSVTSNEIERLEINGLPRSLRLQSFCKPRMLLARPSLLSLMAKHRDISVSFRNVILGPIWHLSAFKAWISNGLPVQSLLWGCTWSLSIRTRLEKIARDFGDEETLPERFRSRWIQLEQSLSWSLHSLGVKFASSPKLSIYPKIGATMPLQPRKVIWVTRSLKMFYTKVWIKLPLDCFWRQHLVGNKSNGLIVNAAAKQHNRVVYSSQAIHHVAQQIASLYWSAVSQDARSDAAFAHGIERTTDLSRQMWGGHATPPGGTLLTWGSRNIAKMPVDLEGLEASEDEHIRSVFKHLRVFSDSSSTCLTPVAQLPATPWATHNPRYTTTAAPTTPRSITTYAALAWTVWRSAEGYPAKSHHQGWRACSRTWKNAHAGG